MSTESHSSTESLKRTNTNALELGPRKKACVQDPLVHFGRHFARTVYMLCNFQALLGNGLVRLSEMESYPDESLTKIERREHKIFLHILNAIPGLEERLITNVDEVQIVAELIRKGASGARGDDTKTLKGAILEWITPKGQPVEPPLSRNIKANRGYNHEQTGALLCPAGLDWNDSEIKGKLKSGELAVRGDQWPVFVYAGLNYDVENPWNGLFKSQILVYAYKCIFTSPSSVDKEPKATRSGNARIHGMTCATRASIAYIATQVRFALTSSPVFSRTDTTTDSERFYLSIIELLDDPDEKREVEELLIWWNRQVFPSYLTSEPVISKGSALAKIREKRAAMKALTEQSADLYA